MELDEKDEKEQISRTPHINQKSRGKFLSVLRVDRKFQGTLQVEDYYFYWADLLNRAALKIAGV